MGLGTAAGSGVASTALGTHCPGVVEGHGVLATGSKAPAPRLGTNCWSRWEALTCAEPPPKAQTAFWLGPVSSQRMVWHEPNFLAWGPAPDPGEDATTRSHCSQSKASAAGQAVGGGSAPVQPLVGGTGGARAWPCPGCSGSAHPSAWQHRGPSSCSPLQGHPQGRDFTGQSLAQT